MCREPKANQEVIAPAASPKTNNTRKSSRKYTGIAPSKSLKNRRLKARRYNRQVWRLPPQPKLNNPSKIAVNHRSHARYQIKSYHSKVAPTSKSRPEEHLINSAAQLRNHAWIVSYVRMAARLSHQSRSDPLIMTPMTSPIIWGLRGKKLNKLKIKKS